MDSLEKLVAAAQDEFENAYVYFAKVGESMGRLENIVKNIRKKADKDKEVAEGGSSIPPKQTPPKCTNDAMGPKGVQSVHVGPGPCPRVKPDEKDRSNWYWDLTPYGIAREIVDKSSYVIPSKCVKYRLFGDGSGMFVEFRVSAEHHHSATTFVAVEEFSIPLVPTIEEQIEIFDHNIGNLITVKFQHKGYVDDDRDWSNL